MSNKLNIDFNAELSPAAKNMAKMHDLGKKIVEAFDAQRNTMKDLTNEIVNATRGTRQLAEILIY